MINWNEVHILLEVIEKEKQFPQYLDLISAARRRLDELQQMYRKCAA